MTRPDLPLLLAALLGLLAVGVGAMGAHAITDPQAKAWIATGAVYGLGHALAVLWARAQRDMGVMELCWGVGALLFSGGLYTLGLGGPRAAAALAPVGGLLMLVGWAALLARAVTRR